MPKLYYTGDELDGNLKIKKERKGKEMKSPSYLRSTQ